MNSSLWIALILGLAGTLVGPYLMAKTSDRAATRREHVAAEHRRRDKQQDWDRQDEVASRVEEAAAEAREVAKRAQRTADLLVESNERVAADAAKANEYVSGQLQQIHTLVNSNMTAAMQAELDARQAQLITLRELVALKQDAGHTPSADVVQTVTQLEMKIAELEANLHDRLEQTRKANEQLSGVTTTTTTTTGRGQ